MTTSSAKAREEIRRAVRSAAVRLPDLFAAGTRLVVGYSGGQDSTALLHALTHAHKELDIVAAHVDHALRADSAKAAQQVLNLSEVMGVPCVVRRLDVAAYRRGLPGWSVQQAARAARYQALASIAEERGAVAVMVGHNADDQSETLLLHLLRGTGLRGLAAMRIDETIDPRRLGPPVPDLPGSHQASLRLARPLLAVSRATTLAYCAHFGLPLVEDASNANRAYARNRVRLDLLPVLEQFNPAIRSVLARTAELAAEDEAALEAIVGELHASLSRNYEYDLGLWRAQPRALQRRLLRFGLESLIGDLVDVRLSAVDDALDLLQTGQRNQTYDLPYGVDVCIGPHTFNLRRADGRGRPKVRNNWEVDSPRV